MIFAMQAFFCGQFIPGRGWFAGKIASALKTDEFLYLHSQLRVVFSNCVALTRLFFDIFEWCGANAARESSGQNSRLTHGLGSG
jgi:hypothetical protein